MLPEAPPAPLSADPPGPGDEPLGTFSVISTNHETEERWAMKSKRAPMEQ